MIAHTCNTFLFIYFFYFSDCQTFLLHFLINHSIPLEILSHLWYAVFNSFHELETSQT